MVINNLRKKTVLTSVLLILAGLIISITGFAISGFNLNDFKTSTTPKWYQTINIDKDHFSFRIKS